MSKAQHRWLIRAVLIALLVPFTVSSNTTPLTWHLFRLHGNVTGPASLDNYTVALFSYTGVSYRNPGWGMVTVCHGDGDRAKRYSVLNSFALTKSDGSYSFNITECSFFDEEIYDTVAVAVVLPDTVLMGEPFRLSPLHRDVITQHVDEGCTGYDRIDGYIYNIPTKNIDLPAELVREE